MATAMTSCSASTGAKATTSLPSSCCIPAFFQGIRTSRWIAEPVCPSASLRPADGAQLSASPAAAEEPVATIGLEAGHADAGRHLEPLQNLARFGIDPPHIGVVAFPGAVPEFAIDPADAGDEAVGLDGAQDRAGLRIDLMDLALPM